MNTLQTWYEWLKRTVFVGGILFWAFMALLQMGVECTIALPTIEHHFKK